MGRFILGRNPCRWRSSPKLCKVNFTLYMALYPCPYIFSEIVKFRDMLEERIKSSKPPLTCIPEEHKPLIAKLGHERYAS